MSRTDGGNEGSDRENLALHGIVKDFPHGVIKLLACFDNADAHRGIAAGSGLPASIIS